MVIEVTPREEDVDDLAMKVFMKTIDLLGGGRKLIEYRNLTWLPSLMAASYVVVYAKHKGYGSDKIAKILGLSTSTVNNILRAKEDVVREKLGNEVDEEKRSHIAGGLAKLAYREVTKEM